MVRSLAVVAIVVLGFGCSGEQLCPAGSEMKDGVCRISTPVGNLDLVLPMPADVIADALVEVAVDVVPVDGTMPLDSTTETQPTDTVETLPTDTVEIQPTDTVETQPADTVEILPTDMQEMLEADVPAETGAETNVPEPSPDTTATEVASD